jgi:hypothetical protein
MHCWLGLPGKAGRTHLPGIYKLDDGTFTLCYARPGKGRPTDFKAKEGSGHSLSVWKQVKK